MLLNTDSYKYSHFLQYPKGTSYISSYIEARGGKFNEIVFFGLQMYLREYLSKPITKEEITEAKELVLAHGLPFNESGFDYILERYDGYLPIKIEAVPEGTVITPKNILIQIQNTDPKCFWLTNFIETSLLRAVWYPSTVATISWQAKQIIKKFLDKTSDNPECITFKLHDFGARGASSLESAGIGSAAHLVNFYGTDTVAGLVFARKYYGEHMAGYSIPATEHSTITSWGKENENLAYENMITTFGGDGKIIAVVSDSYDIYNAIDRIWGEELKEKVQNNGGTLIIRSDSGDPVEVVRNVILKLMDKFGYKLNNKGYKLLPDYLRVIHGDRISLEVIELILSNMEKNGLSTENIAFGMGAELLQKISRDTCGFVMKTSAICIDGSWQDTYKDPATDHHKASKKGRLALIADGSNNYKTIRIEELGERENRLIPVFENGEIIKNWSFREIRERVNF